MQNYLSSNWGVRQPGLCSIITRIGHSIINQYVPTAPEHYASLFNHNTLCNGLYQQLALPTRNSPT